MDNNYIDWAKYYATHGDFILAQLRQDVCLPNVAGEVLIYEQSKIVSIKELVDRCENHGWNSMIYEAWIWETGNQVRSLLSRFDGTYYYDAILIHANSRHELDATEAEAYEALNEAREALEGVYEN